MAQVSDALLGGIRSSSGTLLAGVWDTLFGWIGDLIAAPIAKFNDDNFGGLSKAEKEGYLTQFQNNSALQAEQANYNAALMDKQYALQEQFYNAYQSPEAIINSYRQAGLNPALMYGQATSSSGSGTSISPQGVSSQGSSGSMSGILGLMSSFAQMKNIFSQAKLNEALAGKADAEAESIPVKMELTKAQTVYYNSLPQKVQAEIDNLYAQFPVYAAHTTKLLADAELDKATAGKVIAETSIAVGKFKSEVELLQSQIAKNNQDIKESDSRIAKNNQDIKESVSRIFLNSQMSEYYKTLSAKVNQDRANALYVKNYILPYQKKLMSIGIGTAEAEKTIKEVCAEFERKNQVAGLVSTYTGLVKDVLVGVGVSASGVGSVMSGASKFGAASASGSAAEIATMTYF